MFDLFDYRQVCQFLKRGANLHDEDDNGQVCYFFFLTVPSTCQGCSILYNTCYKLIKNWVVGWYYIQLVIDVMIPTVI